MTQRLSGEEEGPEQGEFLDNGMFHGGQDFRDVLWELRRSWRGMGVPESASDRYPATMARYGVNRLEAEASTESPDGIDAWHLSNTGPLSESMGVATNALP